MKKLKVLWVEDDPNFPSSVIFRIRKFLTENNIEFVEEYLTNGKHVWDVVRDWQPDLIMMDHNLDDVTINGANLIVHIRIHSNETPIIFYSSEMGPILVKMVEKENEVYVTSRTDIHEEIIRLMKLKFVENN
jgi:CheY-like chemotaxis protein